jgi:predicted transcriptional regulator
MIDDFRDEIRKKISEEEISTLKNYVAGARDWSAPSTNDLFALSELQNLLLLRGFANDAPTRFDLLDVAEMIGITPHQMSEYADIGNWIAMDRRFSEMDDEEIAEFYATFDEAAQYISDDEEIAEMLTVSMTETAQRFEEISDLNKLFYDK